MGKVRDHYGSQGDRNLHLPVRGHNLPHGRPCAHGCHKILTNWRLVEAAAAREGLHALGSPYISERASPRGTRCAHRLVPQHVSKMRYYVRRNIRGDLRGNHGDPRGWAYRGYLSCVAWKSSSSPSSAIFAMIQRLRYHTTRPFARRRARPDPKLR